jgi:archaellin
VYKARGNAVAVRRRDGETYLLYQDARKDPDAAGFDGIVWVVAGDAPGPAALEDFRELRDGVGAERGVVVDPNGATVAEDLDVLDARGVAAAIEEHALAAGVTPPETEGDDGDGTSVDVEEWIPPPAADEAPPRKGSDGPSGDHEERSREGGGRPREGADRPPETTPVGERTGTERGRRAPPGDGGERAPPRRDDPRAPPERDERTADRRQRRGRADEDGRDRRGRRDRASREWDRQRRSDRSNGPRSVSARVVGGLLVLVAALLVVALVVTSGGSGGFLETKSQQTGQESKEQVADRLTVVDTAAGVSEGGDVDELVVVLERAPGSGTVELSGGNVEVTAGGDVGQVSMSDPAVSVAAVSDDDDSLSGAPYRLNSSGDRVRLTIALGPDGVRVAPDAGTPATVEVTTADGATTTVEVPTPVERAAA